MNIIDRIFRKKPVIELDDQVFGHITFDRGIWTFIPISQNNGFMITIEAPETGPAKAQHLFFQEIQTRLANFEGQAKNYIEAFVNDGVKVSQLSTYSIEIGSLKETVKKEFVLELSDSEAIVIHRVLFRAGKPLEYGFDD